MIDTTELESLLRTKQWEKADAETRRLLWVARGLEHPPVTPEAVETVAFDDLDAVDRIWSQHSAGNFGLRIQARIWIELGGDAKIYTWKDFTWDDKERMRKTEEQFALVVGWNPTGKWGEWTGSTYETPMQAGALPYQYAICSYGHGLVGYVIAAIAYRFSRASEASERGRVAGGG